QAEDGIRDFHVTGVQTCALPIYEFVAEALRAVENHGPAASEDGGEIEVDPGEAGDSGEAAARVRELEARLGEVEAQLQAKEQQEIGRASCRERGESRGGGGARQR